jgi:hypothetical protein
MKPIIKSIFLFATLLIFCVPQAFAQWEEGELNVSISIPPVALIDIEPAIENSIHFSIVPSAESGASPQVRKTSSGESLWINYSSALQNAQSRRSIVAEISEGILPEGISLNVEASRFQGKGKGQLGQSTGKVSLSNQPQTIITGVGNCFTGDGQNNGHLLTFSIEVSDYAKISTADEVAFTILYTLNDN